MAYTKTEWVNDSVPAINASNLNKIEQGIYDNSFESGSNANGSYIKFNDGTLICWNRIEVSSIAVTSAEGSLYKSDNITPFPDYPIPFITEPSVSFEAISDTGPRLFWIVKSQGDTQIRIRGIRIFAATSMTLSGARLSYMAIGRWK